jgi:hypothetical protein
MGQLIQAWRRLSVHPKLRSMTERRILLQWRLSGRPIPPPPTVKHAIVKEYQSRFGPRVFIETGTFAGGMIEAVRAQFDRVVSIELDPGWHSRAVERFRADPRITLLQGDSGVRLQEVLDALTEPALFWLDAHYSGPVTARGAVDSPIVRELEAIRAHRVAGHVVLIDDMRDFQGAGPMDSRRGFRLQRRGSRRHSAVASADDEGRCLSCRTSSCTWPRSDRG